MYPGQPSKRKRNRAERQNRNNPQKRLLSLRSVVVFQIASLAGIGSGYLLYLAHRPMSLVVMGAIGIFAVAVRFVDDLID
jgi:hypothetical protein